MQNTSVNSTFWEKIKCTYVIHVWITGVHEIRNIKNDCDLPALCNAFLVKQSSKMSRLLENKSKAGNTNNQKLPIDFIYLFFFLHTVIDLQGKTGALSEK